MKSDLKGYMKDEPKAKSKALKMKKGFGKDSDGEITCSKCGKKESKCTC
jgi:hypothetical protein